MYRSGERKNMKRLHLLLDTNRKITRYDVYSKLIEPCKGNSTAFSYETEFIERNLIFRESDIIFNVV